MGRWSRQLSPRFLRWLDAPAACRWLDVGCGTGALSAAVLDLCKPSAVVGVDPSEGFLATARSRLPAHVVLHQAAASQMPLPDAAVDVAASALALNFVPDAAAALREMARVTVRGGHVAVCVWDYAQKMDLIRTYWNAAAQLGLLSPGQDQGERFAICHPDALTTAFTDAGLTKIDVAAIEIPMHFADFDDYWEPFLGGQGPAPAHAMALDEPTRRRLRDHVRATLHLQPDGSILLGARAWAARGVVSS